MNVFGVADLLELARILRGKKLSITIRFIAFVNYEFRNFGTQNMGSMYSASRSRTQNENIKGMFSLEMIGYYSDEPKSQRAKEPILPISNKIFLPADREFYRVRQ